MALGVLQNWVYSESAAMFPEKPGGISLYAHEGWRKYFTFIGPVATFGYWFAWSSVLALFGIVIGSLIKAEWFTGNTWSLDYGTGTLPTLGIEHFIAAGLIVAVWLFNIIGIKPSVWVAYVTGAMLMVPLFVFIVLGYITGDWESSRMSFGVDNWEEAVAWLYIMGWSAYGVETCAAFAPEYKDTIRDTSLALRSAALFSLVVYIFLPMGIAGVTGEKEAGDNPIGFFVTGFDKILGGGSDVMVVLLIGSLLLSMNTATADGSRALYGIARDDMTVKELYHLNRFHVPGRAMFLDMLVNLCLVFFVGNVLAILVAGNLGYMSAHFFALTAFLLLRRDRPNWPRPIKMQPIWLPIVALLAAINAFFIVWGASHPELTGYGGTKETWIGVGVLAFAIVLFVFRRIVQDREMVHFREETPAVPEQAARPASAS